MFTQKLWFLHENYKKISWNRLFQLKWRTSLHTHTLQQQTFSRIAPKLDICCNLFKVKQTHRLSSENCSMPRFCFETRANKLTSWICIDAISGSQFIWLNPIFVIIDVVVFAFVFHFTDKRRKYKAHRPRLPIIKLHFISGLLKSSTDCTQHRHNSVA